MLIDQLNERKRFTKTENEVVSYILSHPQKVTKLTIEQLATVTFSSNSSIVRICKKVGTRGFSDFKIQLAKELSSFAMGGGRVEADIPISPGETREEIAGRILNLQHQTLMEVYSMLDLEALGRAAALVDQSDMVDLYGRGESLMALNYFAADLRRIGKISKTEPLDGFNRIFHYENQKKADPVCRFAVPVCQQPDADPEFPGSKGAGYSYHHDTRQSEEHSAEAGGRLHLFPQRGDEQQVWLLFLPGSKAVHSGCAVRHDLFSSL